VSQAPTIADIHAAHERIRPSVHRTPIHRSRTLDKLSGVELHLKCENFQRGGAFKLRGATNAVLRLPPSVKAVVTHSSGNHAQALALAARTRGLKAYVVMPTTAPRVKKSAVADYGAEIVDCEPTMASRTVTAARVAAEAGAVLIPPFDHPDVIAGQGSVALECLEQVEDAEAWLVPVGGGGLISGMALAARAHQPGLRVIGVEPAGADDACRSLAAGELIVLDRPASIADGLLAGLGELTWPILRDHVERIMTVSDDEIRRAMQLIWERAKLVVEPSGAVTVAAALSPDFRALGLKRVVAVLSGGNVDLSRLPL
jgi:threonine dehydratase/serine racemase